MDMDIYVLYVHRGYVRQLPLSIGKGSMTALKGATRKHERSRGDDKRAAQESEGTCRDIFMPVALLK